MKALTVQQPWAWAIVHGGKDVENRTQAWSYRGPLAIHAGARRSERGCDSPLVRQALYEHWWVEDLADVAGAIIGVVQLVDVHTAHGEAISGALRTPHCCDSPWAELAYAEHGGKTRRDLVHLLLEDPIALPDPVPCRGALGLWTVPAGVDEQVALQLDQAVAR